MILLMITINILILEYKISTTLQHNCQESKKENKERKQNFIR
jgi:hypothetical protein